MKMHADHEVKKKNNIYFWIPSEPKSESRLDNLDYDQSPFKNICD